MQSLLVTAPVPAWVRVLCPHVESLEATTCTRSESTERARPAPSAMAPGPAGAVPAAAMAPLAAPAACSRLHRLVSDVPWGKRTLDLVRQQLASLPSLTSLSVQDVPALDDGGGGGGALCTSVTSLSVRYASHGRAQPHRIAALFPALHELQLLNSDVGDDALDGLLTHLAHVDVSFTGFNLKRSFADRAWPWPCLKVQQLDVDSLARLPLHHIRSCDLGGDREWRLVRPSADAQAAARVADAVRRWGGVGQQEVTRLYGCETSADAVVATLGPLLAALPEQQRRHVDAGTLKCGEATPGFLQQLGAALPPGVKRLSLEMDGNNLSIVTWCALLPSLPAWVERLDLSDVFPAEEDVVDMCCAATRPVEVSLPSLFEEVDALERVRAWLAELGAGEAPQVRLVTLVGKSE